MRQGRRRNQKNLARTHKECLAVVSEILLLCFYPEESRFKVRTDQKVLKCLITMTDPNGRLARWRLRVLEFGFDIVRRAGVKLQVAGALSCPMTSRGDKKTL